MPDRIVDPSVVVFNAVRITQWYRREEVKEQLSFPVKGSSDASSLKILDDLWDERNPFPKENKPFCTTSA